MIDPGMSGEQVIGRVGHDEDQPIQNCGLGPTPLQLASALIPVFLLMAARKEMWHFGAPPLRAFSDGAFPSSH